MAGKTTDEIVVYQRHVRDFIQLGGSKPSNPTRFNGLDAQYMRISGVEVPETGDITPLWVHDPQRAGKFRLIGTSRNAPDLPTATVTFQERHGAVPRQINRIGCASFYEVVGACKDLSDIANGATDYLAIYSNGRVTSKGLGDRSVLGDADEALMDELGFTFNAIYAVGGLSFGEQAPLQVDREVVDIVYAVEGGCQDCDLPEAYTKWIYALTKSSGAGSPGLHAEVVFSTTGGETWQETTITGMGATEDPIAIDIVNDKLIVLSRSAGGASLGGYYYSTINQYTGVPGTWTKVTAGFVSGRQPNDLWVSNPREIYFCADGGYIYKSIDITAGVSVLNAGAATTNNLHRIHGRDNHIVATGASSTVIRSVNRGTTFATTTASISGVPLDVTAVAVGGDDYYWVGTANSGRVYYTETGGEIWTQITYPGMGVGSVRDIVIATDEIIYISHDDNDARAALYCSPNAGVNWLASGSWRILNLPTFDRATRLAVPQGPDYGTIANNLAVGGVHGNGEDGIILLGVAATL